MKILIRGAGDLATGIACRLYNSGYEIVMTDIAVPLAVRRLVSLSRAVYEGEAVVENIHGVLAQNLEEVYKSLEDGKIPIVVDPKAGIRRDYKPDVIVDAIIAKHNLGTGIEDAPFVVGVGPGFCAGEDCHCVVETKRGHYLGSVIRKGSAIPNTGVPGMIGGYGLERLIRAEADGFLKPLVSIGERVVRGQTVARTGNEPVYAMMDGMVRGMLQEDVFVKKGLKIGDIDVRCEKKYCETISDKARAIGGGVLEAISAYEHKGNK